MVELSPDDVSVSLRGEVPGGAVDYARDRLVHAVGRIGDPVLHCEVRLEHAPDPARERPALVEATVDVNGQPVRAHVAAGEIMEAIDLMIERLARRLERHKERLRRQGSERHRNGTHPAAEWRHGDLPSQRPEYFPRPYDERELVRTKSFAPAPMTVDEAAFDLDRLGHDFYLFRELNGGGDAVVFMIEDDGAVGLQRQESATGDPVAEATVPVVTYPPAPVLDQQEAIERLESGRERFVFFTEPASGRGRVVYRRYDGHWGLIRAD